MPTKCICPLPLEEAAKHNATLGKLPPVSALLDHRCPEHGEKAQPRVWGRHKELELEVTAWQWQTLREAK